MPFTCSIVVSMVNSGTISTRPPIDDRDQRQHQQQDDVLLDGLVTDEHRLRLLRRDGAGGVDGGAASVLGRAPCATGCRP